MGRSSLLECGFGLAEARHDLTVFTNANFPRVSVTSDQGDRRALEVCGLLARIHLFPVALVDIEWPRELARDCDLYLEIAGAIRPHLEVNDLDARVESHAVQN